VVQKCSVWVVISTDRAVGSQASQAASLPAFASAENLDKAYVFVESTFPDA